MNPLESKHREVDLSQRDFVLKQNEQGGLIPSLKNGAHSLSQDLKEKIAAKGPEGAYGAKILLCTTLGAGIGYATGDPEKFGKFAMIGFGIGCFVATLEKGADYMALSAASLAEWMTREGGNKSQLHPSVIDKVRKDGTLPLSIVDPITLAMITNPVVIEGDPTMTLYDSESIETLKRTGNMRNPMTNEASELRTISLPNVKRQIDEIERILANVAPPPPPS